MNDSPSPGQTLNVDQITARLHGLLGRESVSDDYVRLRIDLLRAQAAVLAGLAGSAAPPPSAGPTGEGPALAPDLIPFDAALTQRLFDAVVRACGQYGHPGADLPRLRMAVRRERDLLEQLVRHAALRPDEEQLASLGGRLEVSTELLDFVGRLLAAPLVTFAARHASRPRGASPHPSGSCPICGSAPGLASLRPDDGARLLHCSLCAALWRFHRVDCPFCEPQPPSTLVRLTVTGKTSDGSRRATGASIT